MKRETNSVPRISCIDIAKNFGVVRAVDGVSIDFAAGEIHGLIGENGSGKSTLVAMLAGIHEPSAGQVLLNGEPFQPAGSSDAANSGVAIITQENTLLDSLTVAQNLYLGREKSYTKFGLYDFKRLNRDANEVITRILGDDAVAAERMTGTLTFEQKKNIEVARALAFEPKVVAFDETTNALSQRSRERLYTIMQDLSADGVAVIFIAHELSEILETCSRITVLKDGQKVETLEAKKTNADELKLRMVGREIRADYYLEQRRSESIGDVVLSVKNLAREGAFDDVSFEVRAGEILGIGGLSDSGMGAIGEALFGVVPFDSGSIELDGLEITDALTSPSQAVANGIAYVPKDRDARGLMLDSSIKDNLLLPSISEFVSLAGFLSARRLRSVASDTADRFAVKARDLDQACVELSGGNRQKIALSKWFTRSSKVLVLDCPTRGVDVGVKAFIYEALRDLAADGAAIVMITEELPELLGLSDRVLVLRNGRVAMDVAHDANPTERDIIMAMIE